MAGQKIELVADLSQWLDRKNIRVADLNEQRTDAFLAARSKGRCRTGGPKSTLALLLRHLREWGFVPAALPPTVRGPFDILEREYAQFLSEERGLSQSTLRNYLPVARDFLSQRFGAQKVRLKELHSKDFLIFKAKTISNFR